MIALPLFCLVLPITNMADGLVISLPAGLLYTVMASAPDQGVSVSAHKKKSLLVKSKLWTTSLELDVVC